MKVLTRITIDFSTYRQVLYFFVDDKCRQHLADDKRSIFLILNFTSNQINERKFSISCYYHQLLHLKSIIS